MSLFIHRADLSSQTGELPTGIILEWRHGMHGPCKKPRILEVEH